MARWNAVFYFYRDGQRVGTMVVYGDAIIDELVELFQQRSKWMLFEKAGNRYFFIPKRGESP